jgi:dihydroorotate dehydrogenase (NAD+) catalytic subunit
MPDPSVQIGSLKLKNPVIAASGTFGFAEEYSEIYDVSRLGAVCTKGLTLRPRQGNPPPRLWETPGGLLNSIGLQNPGIDAFLEQELPRMKAQEIVTVANVWGERPTEYVEIVERLSQSTVDAVELNLSCPNVPGEMLGQHAEEAGEVVRATRKVSEKPLWVKLPPDARLEVAHAAEQAGADAVCASNTFRAMAIDTETGKPVFEQVFAGLSGPAIGPIALCIVYELAATLTIPVIGIGGITTWEDAVAFMMAGATAIQIGTGNFINPRCAMEIVEKLEQFLSDQQFREWKEVCGCAHRAEGIKDVD